MCTCASSVWSGTEPILLSVFGCHPNPIGKDHTFRPLISPSLSFSFSHCVFQHSSQPSLLPRILPYLLIFPDLSSRHEDRQTSVWCSGAHSCILTGLTHVLASQAPLQSHKLQAAKNVWNFPQRIAIIPILNCDPHSLPCTFKHDFSQIAHDYSFSSPLYPFSIAAEGREPVSDSGILVSKAVDLTINEVMLKPAGQSRQHQISLVFCSLKLYTCLFFVCFLLQWWEWNSISHSGWTVLWMLHWNWMWVVFLNLIYILWIYLLTATLISYWVNFSV